MANGLETVDHSTHLNSSAYDKFRAGFTKSSLDKFNHSRIIIDTNFLQHVLIGSNPSYLNSNEDDLQRKCPVTGLEYDGVLVCRLSIQR